MPACCAPCIRLPKRFQIHKGSITIETEDYNRTPQWAIVYLGPLQLCTSLSDPPQRIAEGQNRILPPLELHQCDTKEKSRRERPIEDKIFRGEELHCPSPDPRALFDFIMFITTIMPGHNA